MSWNVIFLEHDFPFQVKDGRSKEWPTLGGL